MFRVIRIDKLLKYFSWFTIVLSLGIFVLIRYFDPSFSIFKLITITSIVSGFIIFILVSTFFSRRLWSFSRKFNKNLYPDLNGSWEGTVETSDGKKIPVRCLIRQKLLETQIDLHGETMKSITLETTPIINNGQKKLYYTYQATPKNPEYTDYYGTTLFDIREIVNDKKTELMLTGKYYTNRQTFGRITLKHLGFDINKDVSYY